MFELLMAAKKAAPWPTECPFINDVIAIVLVMIEG